jgi:hypothetical protein
MSTLCKVETLKMDTARFSETSSHLNHITQHYMGDRGSSLVKVLCYKIGRSLIRSQLVSLEFLLI